MARHTAFRLFFAQVEYCDNLIFYRRAAVNALEQRLLDANRTIGQPNKLTLIFGRRVTRRHGGKLQTVIEDLNLPNPVIRSHYGKGFLKQYVCDRFLLRTETATNNISTDYGIAKAMDNLPKLRQRLSGIIDRYLACSKISWKLLWTARNFVNSPSPRCLLTADASPV